MKIFNNLIQDHKIINTTLQLKEAYILFYAGKYDIISCIGTLCIVPGDNQIFTRDYISNIIPDNDLYLVVDNIEKKITYSDNILTFLSPLKAIIIRNKSDKIINITFRQFLVKQDIINKLLLCIVYDNNTYYHYGEIHIDI